MNMNAASEPRKSSTKEVARFSLTRPTLTWGDEYRLAYRQAKTYFEPGAVTYDSIAERVSMLVPVSPTTVMRLGYLEVPPHTPSQRQIAWLCLVAMGYDPTDFRLKPTHRALRGMTDTEIRKILDPVEAGFDLRPEDDD